MKLSHTSLILFISVLFFWNYPNSVHSEGAKEISVSGHQVNLYLCNNYVTFCNNGGLRNPFAIYDCPEPDRLYFSTVGTHEIVYMGFQQGSDVGNNHHLVFKIRDLAGNIIYPETNVPTSGTGYIANIGQADVGPFQIYGSGGYTAFDWHPSTPGLFYIEFMIKNNSNVNQSVGFTINMIDITVYDSVALQVKPGRLYSKAWQFYQAGDLSNPGTGYYGTNYIYSSDSIVTSAAFQDLRGGIWVQFCNQWGCANTGNFPIDRKSLHNQQAFVPQYPIFVNPPDSLLYPSATTLGQIIPPDPYGDRNCNNGHIIFHVNVDKAGSAECDLTFPLPYTTRILTNNVTLGENLITWDGLDGSGIPVPNNIPVTFTVKYINGLTNLPLYDVEFNLFGFIIGLVRPPSSSTPLVYWDDSNIPGGTTNFTGCMSPPGCHTWNGPPDGFGNLNTINTWWYNVSTTTVPVTINEFRDPQPLILLQVPPQGYCAGTNAVYFSVTPDPNTDVYNWNYTGTGATITHINPSDPFITVNFAANATSGNITVYGTNANCINPGQTSSLAITIKPLPSVNPPYTKSICSGTSTNIVLSSTPPGSSFSWTTPPPTCSPNILLCPVGLNNAVAINDILSVSNLFPGMVVYHLTPSLNGCPGPVKDDTVNVSPLPDVIINSTTPSICSGQTTNILLSSTVNGTTFTWTASPSSINLTGFAPSGNGDILQTITNSGFTTESVTFTIIPTNNGCVNPNPTIYIVIVFPVPDLSINPSNPSQCSGQTTNILLTSSVAGATFSWTATGGSPNITGFSNGSGNVISQTLISSSGVLETVTYHVSVTANSCPGPSQDVVVQVNPKPHLTNNPMSDTICSGNTTNIHLTSSCLNTTFAWTASLSSGNVTGFSDGTGSTISQTLVNTLPVVGVVNYSIVPTAGSCFGDDTIYYVLVKPDPSLTTSPLTAQICSGTVTNIPLTSDVTGATFSWTATGSSANVSGFAAGSGLNIFQTLVNSGFNTESVTYHITPAAAGCQGPMTDFVVTVYPVADVYFTPASSTICSQQTTNEQILSQVAGATFSWTASSSSLNVTGFSAGSGNMISQTLTNSGITIETVTYLVTPTANLCVGTSSSVIVTVNPTPHVSNTPLAQTICTPNTISVNLTSTVAGSAFAWTCTASSPNLSGFAPGSGSLISQTLSNSGFTIETVTYHITPTANGCPGPVSDYIVTVNPRPDVSNNPMSSQICSGTSPNVNLTSNVSGANFSWTATGSSPNITGYGPGSGLVINQILTNLGLNTEFVTYHITPVANGCTGQTVDYVVTVVQVPDVYFNPPSLIICSQQLTNIQILSNVSGTTFTWTVSASSPNLSGFSPGSGDMISQTLVNSGNTIETVTYTVSPSAFGCPPGTSQNVVVTVNPTPVITNNLTNFQQCNQVTTNIVFQSNVAGSTFTWTVSGSSPNVTGYSAGTGPSIIQTLQNTGFTIETATYAVTPHANGCPGNIVSFIVTVFPVADVYFTPAAQTLCSGVTSNIQLLSYVAGTTFAWTATGSSPNISGFSPGNGNVIQQTLTNSGYSVENVNYAVTPSANGCTGTLNQLIITVNPLPVVSLTTCWDPVTTTNAQPFKLKGGIPLGGTYSGAGVNASIFYPGIAGVGGHTISYSYVNGFGCSGSASQTITVMTPLAFACGNPVTDVRDNLQYATVMIGIQCWMAANLNFGNTIPSSQMQRDNCISEKYCYSDIPANCGSTGGLYQWDEMMKFDNTSGAQGFCPPGWHIPTEVDWGSLFNFYTSNGFAGSPLKFTGYSGYNALLSGVRHENVTWSFNNFSVMFWSSTAHGTNKAWAHGMNTINPSVSYYPSLRSNAFSVRCIKD